MSGAVGGALAIGVRVRRERQSRSWTLDQLAAAGGVSRRMVVNVEQGAANPSVGTLLRISDANPGTRPARFALAVFEPRVGPGSRPEVVNA
jgi:transcriptional regulator with XRE-family HTH domain